MRISRFVGERLFETCSSIVYHPADRNGRMYLCRCLPTFRVGTTVIVPRSKRIRSTGMMSARRYGPYRK